MINHTSMKNHTKVSLENGNCDALRVEVRNALGVLTGKWKLEILFLLGLRLYRFGELRRAIPGITQHMLTTTLRELERDGLVSRTVYPEVPPRVEYQMTSRGRRLGPVFDAILKWAGHNA
jgi:DNA-binding HxlR family transcriptional regulator